MTIASAIPAAVVSMAVLRALGGGGILENNIVQTGASAGSSIASGVIFTVPALVILGLLDRLQVLVGAGHRRTRRHPRRVVLGAAAPLADRRSADGLSRRARPRPKCSRPAKIPAQGVKVLGVSALAGGLVKLSAASGLRLIPDSARHGGILWQVPGLSRHEPVAGAARRGLHRRAQHRHRGACRQRHLLEHRHSDLPRVLPGCAIRSSPPPSRRPARAWPSPMRRGHRWHALATRRSATSASAPCWSAACGRWSACASRSSRA